MIKKAVMGISSSTDLLHWKDEGYVRFGFILAFFGIAELGWNQNGPKAISKKVDQ